MLPEMWEWRQQEVAETICRASAAYSKYKVYWMPTITLGCTYYLNPLLQMRKLRPGEIYNVPKIIHWVSGRAGFWVTANSNSILLTTMQKDLILRPGYLRLRMSLTRREGDLGRKRMSLVWNMYNYFFNWKSLKNR